MVAGNAGCDTPHAWSDAKRRTREVYGHMRSATASSSLRIIKRLADMDEDGVYSMQFSPRRTRPIMPPTPDLGIAHAQVLNDNLAETPPCLHPTASRARVTVNRLGARISPSPSSTAAQIIGFFSRHRDRHQRRWLGLSAERFRKISFARVEELVNAAIQAPDRFPDCGLARPLTCST